MKKVIISIVALVFLLLMSMFVMFKRVPADQIGVRQAKFGGGGVEEQDIGTGLRWVVSGVHILHILPKQTHFLNFTSGSRRAPKGYFGGEVSIEDWYQSLVIRTKGGINLTIDVTVPYKIKEGQAHKLVMEGIRADYRLQVKQTVESVLRGQLALLSSEDFQDTDLRVRKADDILSILNAQLDTYHVVAEIVLI